MDAASNHCYPSKRIMIDNLSRSRLPKDVSMLPLLPEYLTTEVLLRLPVKSLLRFASVCREWHRIITSSSFKKDQFCQGASFTSNLVHWFGAVYNPEGELMLEPDEEDRYDEVNLCTVFPDGALEGYNMPHLSGFVYAMRGPCNGIFCIVHFDCDTITLWNPATRKSRSLPPCPGIELGTGWLDIGFGVDPKTDDLKIVLINIQCEQRQFGVYNTRNDSWKSGEEDALFDPDHYILRNRYGRTFLNGVFYWMKTKRYTRKTSILSFDMRTDSFQEIEMQQILNPERGEETTLDIYDDTLALLVRPYTLPDRLIDIWLMKEQGCWNKHATVYLPPFEILNPVGIWKGNQIYIFTFPANELFVCDVDSGNTRSVGRLGIDVDVLYLYACRYKESLISL